MSIRNGKFTSSDYGLSGDGSEYTADEIEFMNAMRAECIRLKRRWLSYSQMLTVAKRLGYRKQETCRQETCRQETCRQETCRVENSEPKGVH